MHCLIFHVFNFCCIVHVCKMMSYFL